MLSLKLRAKTRSSGYVDEKLSAPKGACTLGVFFHMYGIMEEVEAFDDKLGARVVATLIKIEYFEGSFLGLDDPKMIDNKTALAKLIIDHNQADVMELFNRFYPEIDYLRRVMMVESWVEELRLQQDIVICKQRGMRFTSN